MVSEDKKKKLPVIVALCISAFLRDMKTGTLASSNTILDRIMGKPAQQIDIKPINLFTVMTPEERDKRIGELLKKSEPKKTAKKS
jgi:hypothetical protein